MAKKKVKASPFEALKVEEQKIATELSEQQDACTDADAARPPSMQKREFSKDELERLDQLDALEAANMKLVAENDTLNQKMLEFIQENEDLKKTNMQFRNDNDALLIKISELTFDLAKAQSELENVLNKNSMQPTNDCNEQELNKEKQEPKKPIQQKNNIRPSKCVSYPRSNRNGYTDWN